jgi:hypothetical protein
VTEQEFVAAPLGSYLTFLPDAQRDGGQPTVANTPVGVLIAKDAYPHAMVRMNDFSNMEAMLDISHLGVATREEVTRRYRFEQRFPGGLPVGSWVRTCDGEPGKVLEVTRGTYGRPVVRVRMLSGFDNFFGSNGARQNWWQLSCCSAPEVQVALWVRRRSNGAVGFVPAADFEQGTNRLLRVYVDFGRQVGLTGWLEELTDLEVIPKPTLDVRRSLGFCVESNCTRAADSRAANNRCENHRNGREIFPTQPDVLPSLRTLVQVDDVDGFDIGFIQHLPGRPAGHRGSLFAIDDPLHTEFVQHLERMRAKQAELDALKRELAEIQAVREAERELEMRGWLGCPLCGLNFLCKCPSAPG